MKITIKQYNELTTDELYALLQLRSAVFVVEQDCVYQDIDGKDKKAIHVLGFDADELVAYTRVFKSGDYFKNSSFGRVVVKPSHRKFGLGQKIIEATLAMIDTFDSKTAIEISAQTYLTKFYEDFGFKQVGEGYLEDGIPHIRMLRASKS